MTRNELLRRYLDYGWTVLPVKKGTKMPAVNWKEYQTRKPTNEELREWFKDPDVGIGILTGAASGVIVIDEDSYKEHLPGKTPPATPLVVKTGGGGRHRYYKNVPGLKNTVNKELAIDVRGEGGFVVVPPTLHPTGNPYEWETELPINLETLPTLEEETFLEELYKRSKSTDGTFEPLKIEDYMNISQGSRNDSLYRMACSLINKHTPDEAFELLKAVNSQYDPPLPDHEVQTIARSAYNFVNNHPSEDFKKKLKEAKEHTKEPLKVLNFDEARAEYDLLMKKYGNGITTGFNVLDMYFKLIPQQLYILSAPTHVGKTTLAINICGRMSRAGHRVLYASLEQGVFIVPRMIGIFGSKEGLNNLYMVAPDHMPTTEDFLDLIEKEPTKPTVLVVDHLHYFDRGSKSASEEIDRLVVKLQMLAKKLEIPVVVIAHVRKLNYQKPKTDKDGVVVEPAPTMDDLKDSSSLSQIPSVVMMMQRKRNPEEDIRNGSPVYSNEGILYIYKNRIHGITGSENFKIYDNGEIVFARDVNDRIAQAAMPLPAEMEEKEKDVFDELGI